MEEPAETKLVPRPPERRNPHNLTLYREAVLMKQEKKLLQNLPEILDMIIEKSKNGDLVAAKMFLDRVMAAKKVAEEQEEKGNKQINIVIQGAKAAKVYGKTIEAEFESADSADDIEDGDYDDVVE